eukprot:4252516-Alexandrium_andersonii.AAC.1
MQLANEGLANSKNCKRDYMQFLRAFKNPAKNDKPGATNTSKQMLELFNQWLISGKDFKAAHL